MVAAARNVRSKSKFAGVSMTPLVGQEFLDFFGGGETSPGDNPMRQSGAPKALKEFAPSFQSRTIKAPVFESLDAQADQFLVTPKQVGTVTRTESAREIAQRNAPGTGASTRKDNPLWKQAYDAALISFNKGADARRADEAKRKQQREGRREREDPAVGGGVGSPSGTTLITGAQGFLGGQGRGTSSLLK